MDNEVKEITFGRIVKVAVSRWILLLAITVGVGIAGTLGIYLGYNRMKANYSMTFSYATPDLAAEKYADDSDFVYKNVISYSNLKAVADSDTKYSGIDVKKMSDKGDVSISRDSKTDGDDKIITYTIGFKFKYCRDGDLAKSYLIDLANSVLNKDKAIVENSSFDTSLKLFDRANTFEDQVSFLAAQANNLKSSYESLEKAKGISRAQQETISSNVAEINLLVDENFVTSFTNKIDLNGYVKDYQAQAIKDLAVKKAELQKKLASNNAKITALNQEIQTVSSYGGDIVVLNQAVETLITENVDINYQIADIDRKLDNEGKQPSEIPGYTDFVTSLTYYRTQLSEKVDTYKTTLKSVYIDNAYVSYEDSNIVKLNGSIGLIIAGLISVAAGFVVGAVVNLIVDRKKLYE